MAPTLQYRSARTADVAPLKALSLLAYAEFLDKLTPAHQQTLLSALSDDKSLQELMDKGTVFICEDRNIIAGMACLIPRGNPTDIYPADWAYIRMVGVSPAYRGRGIAKQLTKQCIAAAKVTHASTVGLHTSEMMDTAQHVYDSLGFKPVNEIAPIFGKRYWLYALDISGL